MEQRWWEDEQVMGKTHERQEGGLKNYRISSLARGNWPQTSCYIHKSSENKESPVNNVYDTVSSILACPPPLPGNGH